VLTPRETGQLVQALVTVAFAEGGVDQVGPTQAVAVAVVAVLQTVQGQAVPALEPALIEDAAQDDLSRPLFIKILD